jgi:serine/threonine-protein kinase PRP4
MSHSRSISPSVPSEGEIVEPGPETKATASKIPLNGTSVDRPTRASQSLAPRSPISFDGHRSPRRRSSRTRSPSRSRSRSPYRENTGHKRRHDDAQDDYEKRHPRHEASRRYGSRYDDRYHERAPPSRRPKSYHDYDHEETYGDGLRYSDDYDRREDKRQRTRSRSPYREVRKPKQYSGDEFDSKVDYARPSADSGRHRPTEQLVSERRKTSAAPDSKLGAEKRKNQVQPSSNLKAFVSNEYVLMFLRPQNLVTDICHREIPPNAEVEQKSETAEPLNEDDALEARRKRREAIRAKYRSQATPLHLKALNVGESETDSSTPGIEPTSAKETLGIFFPPY